MKTKHNYLMKKEFSKRINNAAFIVFLLFIGTTAFSQTTVNSLTQLLPYLDDNNANVKLAPGTYTIDNSNIDDFDNPIFLFEGNNSTYDFTGVTINFATEIFRSFGNVGVEEIEIVGNNNVLKNLKMVDIGSVYDRPTRTALGISLHGEDNLVEGFDMTVKGSQPYGYGDAFGKGSGYVIKHFKHSAIQVGGNRNHVKNCKILHRAYGHGIFMQGAVDALIEGVYLEGEMRTTDAMLAGAYGGEGDTGEDVDWVTVWGYPLPKGYMLSLQEDGIRAYNSGTTIINGNTITGRRTTNITVLNCTVKYMRGGFPLALSAGTKYLEGCTSIGCETGFTTGTSKVVDCYSDAAYGPAYKSTYNTTNNFDADITIIPPANGYYNGSNCLAYIGGNNHEVTLRNAEPNLDSDLIIMMAGDLKTARFLSTSDPSNQTNHTSTNIEFTNHTGARVVISNGSSGNDISSCGSVTDNGSNNDISTADCDEVDPPTGCTDYVSNVTPPSNLVSGINYAYYEGTWDNLPNFDALTPEETGISSAINLDNAASANYFGFTFDGYINLSSEGEYTFYTASDDGSALWIDGNQVVNNDGLHGMVEKSGTICLEAGYHKIEIAYFEKTGGNSLTASYAGSGISKTTISNLYAQGETSTEPGDFPDPNKTYYIDSPYHDLRLAATGESEDAYTTSTSSTSADVEWRFVDKGNGYWHIERAAGGSTPRLRTDKTENADMQSTAYNKSWTYFDFTPGAIADTYFITLPDVDSDHKRLQIDGSGAVKMVEDTRNGTWESFRITEASAPEAATFYRIEAEDYDAMSGIKTEVSTESGENVGWIDNGDWLRFDDIDLTGAQSVDLRIACNFIGGIIEIRAGSTTGTLLGSTSVSNTGGNQKWITLSASISNISGVQDVYLVFKGGSGALFNINWLEFSADSLSSKNLNPTNQVLVYPTLVEDIVNIKLNASQSSVVISIINISGQVVASKNIINNDVSTMNLGDIPSGLYIMKITDLEGSRTKKIVKK